MKQSLELLAQTMRQHPRRIMAGLGALLLGTGVTAVAVAPLTPDAADLPVTLVVESVTPMPLVAAVQAAAPAGFELYHSDLTRRNDSVQSLLKRLGVRDSEAAAFLGSDPTTKRLLLNGSAGKLVSAQTDDKGRLIGLKALWPASSGKQFSRLQISRGDKGLSSRLETGPLERKVRLAGATIRSTLFEATEAARLPDSVAEQLADVFDSEIDFRNDLAAGDRFQIVYETFEADGEVLSYGQLLGAEFVNRGQKHQVVWFQQAGDKGAFFTPDGQSLKRSFLASPLPFTRVSSRYGMRFHPISGRQQAHLGVDFAAPTGTPVRAVADGRIEFAGWKTGYGNLVTVRHDEQKSTAYAHLSRIGVRKGQSVAQGDPIGAVGSTGASTGPHLHFEYLVKGQHQDPLTLARNAGKQSVPATARAEFKRVALAMREQLDAAATVVQASAE
ncbi:MAG: hypothetical protein RLZZ555_718 [Pseudomonadota bacterium]|jgi:murein DD-endopeptidase MepM/ murein hydrolase activator NlpD